MRSNHSSSHTHRMNFGRLSASPATPARLVQVCCSPRRGGWRPFSHNRQQLWHGRPIRRRASTRPGHVARLGRSASGRPLWQTPCQPNEMAFCTRCADRARPSLLQNVLMLLLTVSNRRMLCKNDTRVRLVCLPGFKMVQLMPCTVMLIP